MRKPPAPINKHSYKAFGNRGPIKAKTTKHKSTYNDKKAYLMANFSFPFKGDKVGGKKGKNYILEKCLHKKK